MNDEDGDNVRKNENCIDNDGYSDDDEDETKDDGENGHRVLTVYLNDEDGDIDEEKNEDGRMDAHIMYSPMTA